MLKAKTDLDKPQLLDACKKIRKVKALPKTAYYEVPRRAARSVYGKTFSYFPTAGLIFAFDSIDLATLGAHLTDWCGENEVPAEERPDSVWVLGKGFLVWTNPDNGKVDVSPEPGAGLLALERLPDRDVLFPLAMMLSAHFNTAWMPPLRLIDYAADHGWGAVVRTFQQSPAPPSAE